MGKSSLRRNVKGGWACAWMVYDGLFLLDGLFDDLKWLNGQYECVFGR